MKFSVDEDLDIEWFARDRSGVTALFLTAGAGFFPADWHNDDQVLEQIFALIPIPRWGSSGVMQDYADAGLFVYDWNGSEYRLVQLPTTLPTDELLGLVGSLSSVPVFDANFEPGDVITIDTAVLAT